MKIFTLMKDSKQAKYKHSLFLFYILTVAGCSLNPSSAEPGTRSMTESKAAIRMPALPQDRPYSPMINLRKKMLSSKAAAVGISPSKECSKVFAVAMDWPVGKEIVTVIGVCDGNASLYTTSTFGVIGGVAHENVRIAAKEFVKTAAQSYELTKPTKEYPYPPVGFLRFYLLCFDGVRVVTADVNSVVAGENPLSRLGSKAQRLIAELRLVVGA
jgi:hypothetical protein